MIESINVNGYYSTRTELEQSHVEYLPAVLGGFALPTTRTVEIYVFSSDSDYPLFVVNASLKFSSLHFHNMMHLLLWRCFWVRSII